MNPPAYDDPLSDPKFCSPCQTWKGEWEFYDHPNGKHGTTSVCKKCKVKQGVARRRKGAAESRNKLRLRFESDVASMWLYGRVRLRQPEPDTTFLPEPYTVMKDEEFCRRYEETGNRMFIPTGYTVDDGKYIRNVYIDRKPEGVRYHVRVNRKPVYVKLTGE